MVLRIDRSAIQKATRTPEGFLRAPAYATRIGVFLYRRADGSTVREFRPPEEVFKADSLASLACKPVTDGHPSTGRVDAKSARELSRGHTGETVERDGDFVRTSVTILDGELVEAIDGGKSELSCGYVCELEEAPGEFNGERYDMVQRNIQYNHLAVVAKGRAGPDARLRLDAADAEQVPDATDNGEKTMKLKVDGKEIEVSDEAGKVIEQAIAKRDGEVRTALDSYSTTKARLDQAEAKADAFQGEVEKLKGDLKKRTDGSDAAAVRAAVRERMGLCRVAERLLPKEQAAKLDEMDDRAIREAVIKADAPQTDLSGKSDEYVKARFDHVAEASKKDEGSGGQGQDLGRQMHENRADASTAELVEEARRRQAWDARHAYMANPPPYKKQA